MAKIKRAQANESAAGGVRTVAPYGSWKSAISSDLIVQQSISLSEVRLDGDDIYWVEDRPQEDGRSVIVRAGGPAEGINPQPFSARDEVHSYGGGAWVVDNGNLYFSNFTDGRLYRQDRNTTQPHPITPAPLSLDRNWRYADGFIDRHRNRWIGVREDHTDATQAYPVNTIVAVDLNDSGSSPGTILASGHDFFSSPRLSPDGNRLAWLAWDHPNMPWTSTTLYVVALDHAGIPTGEPAAVAGGGEISLFQPEWAPDGSALFYVSDQSSWWNIYSYDVSHSTTRCIQAMAAEFGRAQWRFGMSTYAFAGPGRVVAAYVKDGLMSLASLDLVAGQINRFELPFTDVSSVRADARGRVVFCGGAPDTPMSVVRLDLNSGAHLILKQATDATHDPNVKRFFTAVTPVRFPTTGRRNAYALYYPPANPDFTAPKGDRPPLFVRCHGGPTAAAPSALDLRIHYWTSRGIAVADVNYSGSTGYGRRYRNRLHRRWGIVDVDDCVNAAKYLAARRGTDRRRSIISGGSAGGYTTLAALTFRKYFAGGASYYGVSDISALTKDTHKFEAHYLDWLIGPYPKDQKTYRARSPLFHAERVSKPVIFFQGDEDPIVPPNQAEKMVKALRRRKIPAGYLLFAGERHGFRMAANIKRALDAELYFYATEVFRTKLLF
jgi:dipeptidyl aminopeptidase/acylaminoacyl peptidase